MATDEATPRLHDQDRPLLRPRNRPGPNANERRTDRRLHLELVDCAADAAQLGQYGRPHVVSLGHPATIPAALALRVEIAVVLEDRF